MRVIISDSLERALGKWNFVVMIFWVSNANRIFYSKL